MSENELMHYGRQGMKWYQHIYGEYQRGSKYAKKGTAPKPSGKKSTALKRAKDKKAEDKKAKGAAADKKDKARLIKSIDPIKRMSDKDLNAAIDRLTREQKYRDLLIDSKGPLARGRRAVTKILADAAKQTATTYVKRWMSAGMKSAESAIKKAVAESVAEPVTKAVAKAPANTGGNTYKKKRRKK